MTARAQAGTAPRCFVYIIGSRRGRDSRTYVGWTLDLDRRLLQHNSGTGAKSTRGRAWRLLYAECCPTRGAAMSREWHLKRARKLRQALREILTGPAKDQAKKKIRPRDRR